MAVRERTSVSPVAVPAQINITVGVHGDDGSARHGAANDEGQQLTVADVASFHEFGTETIPQRSFIRAWYDEESQDFIAKTLQSQMKLAVAGKITAEVASERIALAFEGSVKQRIARGIPPPNAASTIERKGSSKPLIDTGQLRNAIRGKAVIR